MDKYYLDSKLDTRNGREIHWVYKRGEVPHFATFYDVKKAKEYIDFLNSKYNS
jgi:hypothetical protein